MVSWNPTEKTFKKKRVINYVINATAKPSWKIIITFCNMEVTVAYDNSCFSGLIGAKSWLEWVWQSLRGKFLVINIYAIFEELYCKGKWLVIEIRINLCHDNQGKVEHKYYICKCINRHGNLLEVLFWFFPASVFTVK